MLSNKKILIGITGSIAAYKIIYLVRLLVQANAEVKVVLTPSAKAFVSPLVLSTLSKNAVITQLADESDTWQNHVMLGRWADVMIIAPLTCNTLAKMTTGICDNMLLAIYLSATCKVLAVPAMDEDMWHHNSTQNNLKIIESYGNKVLQVNTGELASGLFGKGRMAEPEEIFAETISIVLANKSLKDKHVLITAGPTQEAIDPVRYITNHSSGKMGYAIAEAAYLAGAKVSLVSGPVNIKTNYTQINIINVTTAQQMFEAVDHLKNEVDVFICSAAVADYKVAEIATEKIKKKEEEFNIVLNKNIDILKSLGACKQPHQKLIGFALETNNALQNATQKLETKNADAIILNELNTNNQVFGSDENKATMLLKNGKKIAFDCMSKQQLAQEIITFIAQSI